MIHNTKGRIIGIRHRVKATAKGEARPTQLVILENGNIAKLDLENETEELDFVRGYLPVKYRAVTADEDLTKFRSHQIKKKQVWKDDDIASIPENLLMPDPEDKKTYVATKVPTEFTGMQPGDSFAMVLGGSGDSFAYGLSNTGVTINARVFRIPAYLLKVERGDGDKDNDAELLANLLIKLPGLFYEVMSRDRDLINVSECFRARMEAMRARIACEQRLRSFFIGKLFRTEDGPYPEGGAEDLFNIAKASNAILAGLEKEEAARDRDLAKAVAELDVYRSIFADVEGCGPAIAAGIVATVIDIRRFATAAKFKAFMGAHVLKDGSFPRRRVGETSNWHPNGRQALFNFADQMNRRPNSEWGKRFREYKDVFRQRHPVVLCSVCNLPWEECSRQGKDVTAAEAKLLSVKRDAKHARKYTNGHIHKMAWWRTITKFSEWLYGEWWKLEKSIREVPKEKSDQEAA